MAVFNSMFDTILYDFNDGASKIIIKDITKNYRLSQAMLNSDAMMAYSVPDGELPWVSSQTIYGNPYYDWVILQANNGNWPLSSRDLVDYINATYTNIFAAHHYVNSAGFIVNSTAIGATMVTNYDYEVAKNDALRVVKVIKPSYIKQALAQMGIK